MKFYQKKDVPTEESPILLQLQRRHTIVGKVSSVEERQHKSTSRSSSVSSVDKTKSPPQDAAVRNKKSADSPLSPDDTRSSLSNASTVVITESELSSSWLYKNKKAQMDTNANLENTCDSTAQLAPNIDGQKSSPTSPRPLNPNVTNIPRSKRFRACCCYTIVTLIICIVSLGIMSAIGSIIYMEFFVAYNVTDNLSVMLPSSTSNPMVPNHDIFPLRKMGDLLDSEKNETVPDSLKLPVDLVFGINVPSNFKFENMSVDLYTQIVKGKNGVEDIINEVNDTNSGNEKQEVPDLISMENKTGLIGKGPSFNSNGLQDEIINKGVPEDIQREAGNIDTLPLSHHTDKSPYSKLFELYKGLLNIEFKNQTNLKDTFNLITDNSTSRTLARNESDFINDRESEEMQLSETDSTLFALERDEADDFKKVQMLLPKLLPHVDKTSENKDLEFFNRMGDLNENSEVDNSSQDNQFVSQASVDPLEMNRPVVEANIAIPAPVELLRRLKLKEGLANVGKPHVDQEAHDRRFSLAKALETLRMLDVKNQLPSSRQKLTTGQPTSQRQNNWHETHSEEEIGTERNHYLQNLRKKLFDG